MRRQTPLTALCLLVPAALLGSIGTSAQGAPGASDTATGVVFEDRDKDGVHDDREPGVPNVSVSNGRDVVQSDAHGRFSLEVTDETIVFITKPAGYMVPVSEHQLPLTCSPSS